MNADISRCLMDEPDNNFSQMQFEKCFHGRILEYAREIGDRGEIKTL